MAAYATVAQLKIRVPITSTLTADEEEMYEEMLDAASRLIEGMCGKEEDGFVGDTVAEDRYYPADGESYLLIDPCIDIETVAVRESTTATTYTDWTSPTTPMAGDGDWIPCTGSPETPVYSKLPYTIIRIDPNGDHNEFIDSSGAPVVKVTAKWGRSVACPGDIREATIMQCLLWRKRYSGAMASQLGSQELGQLLYRKSLDSAVVQILVDGGHYVPLYGGRV